MILKFLSWLLIHIYYVSLIIIFFIFCFTYFTNVVYIHLLVFFILYNLFFQICLLLIIFFLFLIIQQLFINLLYVFIYIYLNVCLCFFRVESASSFTLHFPLWLEVKSFKSYIGMLFILSSYLKLCFSLKILISQLIVSA